MTSPAAPGLPPRAREIASASYDRTPTLSDNERRVTALWLTPGLHVITRGKIPRLYDPLAHALLQDGEDRVNRLGSMKRLFREVGRLGRAYWGWSDEQWLDLMHREPMQSGHILAVTYLLCGFRRLGEVRTKPNLAGVARVVFGRAEFDRECERLLAALEAAGYRNATLRTILPSLVAIPALAIGDHRLESFDADLIKRARDIYPQSHKRQAILSTGLATLGLLPKQPTRLARSSQSGIQSGDVHPEWMEWCRRWDATSTMRSCTRQAVRNAILRVGIWLARAHPEVTGPQHWTVDICADYLAAVDRLKVAEWTGSKFDGRIARTAGKPLAAPTKMNMYRSVRRFPLDVEAWGWIKLRCNPSYHLSSPQSVRSLLCVNPRALDDAVWLKLVWASLNLTAEDVAITYGHARYPLEIVKAAAVVWTHAGLRRNEIVRLKVGCTSIISDDVVDADGRVIAPGGRLCLLSVPINKTSGEYVKPVAAAVHTHIQAWQRLRPDQPRSEDDKTGELVHMLFQLRNARLGPEFVNRTIIPLLCRKAGVQQEDSMGRITSHRGRASAVTTLANAPDGMNIFELRDWCGHKSANSTLHYAKIRPTRLARSFAKADSSARMIGVVLDHEAIARGVGDPWKYYDLGHSYCGNAFWSACPHRMACAGCDFNVPKQSAKGMVLAAHQSTAKLLEEVWLSPDERKAVEGDVAALDSMLAKLRDVPTPDGRTPAEIPDTA